jgi:hypothetical protein
LVNEPEAFEELLVQKFVNRTEVQIDVLWKQSGDHFQIGVGLGLKNRLDGGRPIRQPGLVKVLNEGGSDSTKPMKGVASLGSHFWKTNAGMALHLRHDLYAGPYVLIIRRAAASISQGSNRSPVGSKSAAFFHMIITSLKPL